MPRLADFTDAHRRHREDADLLFDKARWANADHLYGLSAECGLKVAIETLGIQVAEEYRQHVDRLWPEYRTLIENRGETRYLVDGNPFSDWSIAERYAHRGHVDRARAQRHRKGAEEVRLMLENVAADGRP